jgi:hypothetical protein
MAKKIKARPTPTSGKTPNKPIPPGQPSNLIGWVFYFLAPLIFISLPQNKAWLQQRVLPYFREIPEQRAKLDTLTRSMERHGQVFNIFDFVCKNVPKGSRFLLPPQTYYLKSIYDKNNPNAVNELYNYLAESNIFSYHCMDVRPITLGMPEDTIKTAQYTVFITPEKQIALVEIKDENIYQEVRKAFGKPSPMMTDRNQVIQYITSQ